jgi:ribosome maturation protein Sdo1
VADHLFPPLSPRPRLQYKKYTEDPSSVPLVEVVDSFEIFFSGTGATGTLGKASKQQLDTVFGTSKDIDAVSKLLELGKLQKGDSISDNAYGDGNKSRGTMQQGVNGGR